MSPKICLLLVIFSLAAMMIAADSRKCLRNGLRCFSHHRCCSKMSYCCIPGQARAAPPGFMAPKRSMPPQEPGQSGCAKCGFRCCSTKCCAPCCCANLGIKCV